MTGDERYEKMYFDILAIRNGKLPRPQQYSGIYWDLMIEYGDKPKPDSSLKKPLLELMKDAGFSKQEFNFIAQAAANSDALVHTETVAMNAIKGLYDDGNGNFTVQKTPNKHLAMEMMHDVAYHTEKAKIMAPVEQFLQALTQRTQAQVDTIKNEFNSIVSLITTLVFILAFATLALLYIFKTSLINPLQAMAASTRELRNGDGDLTKRLPDFGNNEIGQAATELNGFISKV